jgi:aminoglycoside phosphotransferase (APT) family kinase protein
MQQSRMQAMGNLIAKGFCGELRALENGRALKLLFDWAAPGKALKEFEATRAVNESGYPSPRVFEVVTVEGRQGIVMERIDGPSMFDLVRRRPWKLFWSARMLGELHAQLHGREAPPGLRTQREQVEDWIARAADLSPEDRKAAVEASQKLPVGSALCHADFHPDNILITAKGPVVIDWSGATCGHPMGDVARTVNLIRYANLPQEAPAHLKVMLNFSRRILLSKYLQTYFRLRPGRVDDLAIWEPIQKAVVSAWRCSKEWD